LLLGIPRTSVEPMVLQLHGAEHNAVRAVQQFVGESTWDDHPILQQPALPTGPLRLPTADINRVRIARLIWGITIVVSPCGGNL
jgi:hypothetical protein